MTTNRILAGAALAVTAGAFLILGPALGLSPTFAGVIDGPVGSMGETTSSPTLSEPSWEASNWWTYKVTLGDDAPVHVAVVVHDVDHEGIHVGTNDSNGFMGLPIGSTFSHDLSPRFAGETWRMYDFPLHDGKAWDQSLFGYNLNTTVEAMELKPSNGAEATKGYALEANAYSQTVATYTYHPEAGWFTELSIYDPQNGERIFHAELKDHGSSWDQAYFVTHSLHEVDIAYPETLPGDERFEVPDGYEEAHVHLRATVSAGAADASVHDSDGEEAASVRVVAHGFDIRTASVDNPEGDWRLSHVGSGHGEVILEIFGVQSITPEQAQQDPREDRAALSPAAPVKDSFETEHGARVTTLDPGSVP